MVQQRQRPQDGLGGFVKSDLQTLTPFLHSSIK